LCVGGYASADSAEEHGGTTGSARGAPLKKEAVYGNKDLKIHASEKVKREIP